VQCNAGDCYIFAVPPVFIKDLSAYRPRTAYEHQLADIERYRLVAFVAHMIASHAEVMLYTTVLLNLA
jgi:hypothetical protein